MHKGDVSSVRALLLQKWYEIILQELSTGTLMKSTFWWENDKLVEKDNQAREFELEAYSHFWLHNWVFKYEQNTPVIFLEFDWQMTKTDQVW